MSPCKDAKSKPARHLRKLTLVICSLLLAVRVGHAGPEVQGQWSPATDWSGGSDLKYAVHLLLLPSEGPEFHSRVVWYRADFASGFFGGEWGWNPGGDGCSAFPSSSFDPLAISSPGVDIFCAGHTGLAASGQVLLPGGTSPTTGFYGENKTNVLTAGTGDDPSDWDPAGEMATWRWYPSATTLKSGQVITLGGQQHKRHRILFGRRDGVLPSGSQADSLYRFAPVQDGLWERSVIPEADPTNGRPDPRELHSMADLSTASDFGGHTVFGGWDSTSATVHSDTWVLKVASNIEGDDFTYEWEELQLTESEMARADHAAVNALNTLLVFGGRDEEFDSKGDVRRLFRNPGTGIFDWQELTPSGTGPSARYGHAAVFSSDMTSSGSVNRMVIFGGRSDASTPLDATPL